MHILFQMIIYFKWPFRIYIHFLSKNMVTYNLTSRESWSAKEKQKWESGVCLAARKGVPELTVLVLELVSEVSAAKKVGKQGIACCVMQCTLLG